ncbi:MAG: helix-turn-helix domain-containing protein [Lachnospiraceae bacterium]|nr:helix-turn-helix domain-containing protein [Lachnospiraceae bacterium]
MNERIKELRKALHLTQQEFADRLGIPRNNIAGYETGKRSPSEAVLALICRVFQVQEDWIKSGNGEMFDRKDVSPLETIAKKYNLSQKDLVLIERFAEMDKRQRDAIINYIKDVASKL